MKKQIAKLWANALRSGDYKQGRGQLRTEQNKFCCLGVLCNLHALAHPEIAAKQSRKDSYLGSLSFLSEEVIKWAGIKASNYSLKYSGEVISCSLIRDNDGLKKNFKQIADTIDKHYKEF